MGSTFSLITTIGLRIKTEAGTYSFLNILEACTLEVEGGGR